MLFRPSPSHTHRTRDANSRLGFIAAGHQDGGDALPLHDTDPEPHIAWKSAPTRPGHKADDSFTDEIVILGELESPAPHGVAVPVPIRSSVLRSHLDGYRRITRWLPWSIAVGATGVGAVRLAVVVAGTVDMMIGALAFGVAVSCALLLVAAQCVQASER